MRGHREGDDIEARGFGATIGTGSFGRRSGSFGLLAADAATALPPRKASKGKESRLRWIQRSLVRKKVGALVVFFVCAIILIPHISISTVYVQHIVYFPSNNFQLPQVVENDDTDSNTASTIKTQSTRSENENRLPIPILHLSNISHPCGNFSFPPPPADSKRVGPRPCPVCYIPQQQAIALMPDMPSVSPVLKNLAYVSEENLFETESDGGLVFGGYPSLQQRTESFDIRESMSVHCGFVRGKKPCQGTGFDIDDADLLEMEQCRGIVVASAIFGNFDIMKQPKNIRESTQRSVCFYMFVDEDTEAYIKNSSALDSGKGGCWRVVVVRNLPYRDSRRNGKVPKLLLHRLFPNARFSLWIDGKLQLIVDPYQILERFLWRENATFAVSRHYKRFDVFEEAEANKAGGKYDNASIDHQIEFYKNEGLTPYSVAKLPITSDVPEGCVIIREHVPIANLFSCLWFNEVERFTSRDQLSFGILRDKIRSKVNWNINMFKDCERRNFVIQSYHKELLDKMSSDATRSYPPPPPASANETDELPLRKLILGSARKRAPSPPVSRRGRDRRSGGSRRHRSGATHGRYTDSN